MISRQIVGGTSARSRSCYASRRTDRGRGSGTRGVHLWTATVPASTGTVVDGAGSCPSSADQTSADGTTVRPPQRLESESHHGPYVQPEPATGSARRGADGAGGRKSHGLLQPKTPLGEVPAHRPRAGGATGGHRGPGGIGETCRSLPVVGLAARPITGRRRAAVRLHPDRRRRRGCRLLPCLVGDAHARSRRLRIHHERRAPRPRIGFPPTSRLSASLPSAGCPTRTDHQTSWQGGASSPAVAAPRHDTQPRKRMVHMDGSGRSRSGQPCVALLRADVLRRHQANETPGSFASGT
jgi:hypothetical protein